MGLFKKQVVEEQQPVVEEVVKEEPVVAPKPEVKKPTGTIVATGVTLVGNFETEEQMDIYGTVQGDINSSVDTHVAQSGKHIGHLNANSLHAEGKLESDVVCNDLTSLSDTAVFKGTLKTAKLDSAHGSEFQGTLNLSNKAPAAPAAPAVPAEEEVIEVKSTDDLNW